MSRFVDVDPRTLYVGTQRAQGADPVKLHWQLARFGRSIVGMPAILVIEDADGKLEIMNGVTRATRVAKFLPGVLVSVEVMSVVKWRTKSRLTIGDLLP